MYNRRLIKLKDNALEMCLPNQSHTPTIHSLALHAPLCTLLHAHPHTLHCAPLCDLSIHPSVHFFTHLSAHPSVHPSAHPSMHIWHLTHPLHALCVIHALQHYSQSHRSHGSWPFHDFDWYNSCGPQKCPLAVNGSCQQETPLGSVPARGFLGMASN